MHVESATFQNWLISLFYLLPLMRPIKNVTKQVSTIIIQDLELDAIFTHIKILREPGP